jgi:catechol 2,3-dioxygenase-like lactoylglutathione lyase family enzyme
MSRSRLDHLVVGVPDLEAGLDWLQAQTGIRAAGGGTYDGAATATALASLGGRSYLSLTGPDGPAPPPATLGAHVAGLPAPRLVAWACVTEAGGLDALVAQAESQGLPATVREVGRRRPDGRTVKSRHLYLEPPGGNLPFFVEAGTGVHPSIDAPAGLRLRQFQVVDPDPEQLGELLKALGVEVDVLAGDQPGLSATISSPTAKIVITG